MGLGLGLGVGLGLGLGITAIPVAPQWVADHDLEDLPLELGTAGPARMILAPPYRGRSNRWRRTSGSTRRWAWINRMSAASDLLQEQMPRDVLGRSAVDYSLTNYPCPTTVTATTLLPSRVPHQTQSFSHDIGDEGLGRAKIRHRPGMDGVWPTDGRLRTQERHQRAYPQELASDLCAARCSI